MGDEDSKDKEAKEAKEAKETKEMRDEPVSALEAQECPVCKEKTLTLTEMEKEIPYFSKVFIFSMSCSNCNYHKADVECAEQRDPVKYSFEVSSEDDLKVRVVRSGEATVKIPHVITIEPGPSSNGYVTNIEGILNRVKKSIEIARDSEEDEDARKKAKNLLKKLNRAMWGQEKLKVIIEDPTGNSAIISDRAEVSKLKK